MPRKFYRKRYTSGAKDKYSIEQTVVTGQTEQTLTNGLYQMAANIVPASPTQGMRKVKHLTVSLTAGGGTATTSIFWAVVYVPEGYNVNPLRGNPGASFYEPNNFIMACGCNDPEAGPIRIRSPISRNLNSGDSIWIVIGTPTAATAIRGLVQYAVTLQ